MQLEEPGPPRSLAQHPVLEWLTPVRLRWRVGPDFSFRALVCRDQGALGTSAGAHAVHDAWKQSEALSKVPLAFATQPTPACSASSKGRSKMNSNSGHTLPLCESFQHMPGQVCVQIQLLSSVQCSIMSNFAYMTPSTTY